ncbi:MAG: pyruvate, phosphate dikinase [Oligoflexia bacterium]|nr:pyruvate, phosphate dikinase [Oligoflexia bacterium]
MSSKNVFFFGSKTEGEAGNKNLLGGKGANLAEMTKIGLPVPPGFTITTEMCIEYYKQGKKISDSLLKEIREALAKVEKDTGKKFGDANNPLLVSVRSGARVSMPGMMDTVLNLGLNENTLKGLIGATGNERFAYDAYRRFIQMYSNVVMGMNPEILEHILTGTKEKKGVKNDTELTAADLKQMVADFKAKYREKMKSDFPEDPMQQLIGAISAVFGSWNNERACIYRRMHGFSDDWGTAVNVQAMVFGNMGEDCATGVAFTRNPSTGENKYYGEFLINAQGEDVVAGIRTPQPVNKDSVDPDNPLPSMEEVMPAVYKQLANVFDILEKHYKDMQDIEFTVEKNKLYMLQTRNGKRTAMAAVKIACDMLNEKLINEKEAVLRVAPEQVDQLLHPMIDPKASKTLIAKGLPASPGAATGQIVFTAQDADEWASAGKKVILVRHETSPEDIKGMVAAQGILTALGGMTSHAAVVARGMGKCCVAGCGQIKLSGKTMSVSGKTYKEGDIITLNGSNGEVYDGNVGKITPELSGDFGKIMDLADKYRKLKVRTNADTPHDSSVARKFGAEGIGLCRTEHMFFEGDRVVAVREMILSSSLEEREKALAKLEPMQKQDFVGIFREMKGLPVTIRLLDPPLHEFLPHTDAELEEVARNMDVPIDMLKSKSASLHEFNPMLGHRGCRLGISYPEIYKMQVRAIIEAACELVKNEKMEIVPEIMIPLVGKKEELAIIKEYSEAEIKKTMDKNGVNLKYMIGTMIELPRAAITSDRIAEEAEFFSFGTNDLTQTTMGLSRDDSGNFLPDYVNKKIYSVDPFVSIDQEGVGELMKISIEKGRKTRKNIKLGICGEHGGEPQSVIFCHKLGLDYVSCSPYRVPVARLAAAHANLMS